MTRRTQLVVATALLAWLATPGLAAQRAIYESEPKVVTATIEAVDKTSRVVTLRTEAGSRLHVAAAPEMEGFSRLEIGDIVTAKYFEAMVVRLAHPDAPEPTGTPWTSVRREDNAPGTVTTRERTVRATVTSVDPTAPSLTIRGSDGVERGMAISDASQLAKLKVGDVIDVTFYESRMVSFERPKK